MFPLESVLLPGMVLPLHIFEDRYRALARACVDGDGEFGVVLIERGSEVGGGDVRSPVGTIAQVVQAEELADGRWAMVALGVRRARVDRWLEDAPYPLAEVSDWPDVVPEQGSAADAALRDVYGEGCDLLRRALGLAAELGQLPGSPVEVAADPVIGSYHLSILAPFGSLDRQRLLCAEGPSERLALATALLHEEILSLEAQRAERGDA